MSIYLKHSDRMTVQILMFSHEVTWLGALIVKITDSKDSLTETVVYILHRNDPTESYNGKLGLGHQVLKA